MTCRRSRSPTASAGHVNRPTPRAHGLRPGELQHGRALLDEKLAALHVPRMLFTFKAGAQALLGTFEGHGLLADRTLAGAEVFVMPGPMERTDRVQLALAQLADWGHRDDRRLERESDTAPDGPRARRCRYPAAC
jgi:hypothetical protein